MISSTLDLAPADTLRRSTLAGSSFWFQQTSAAGCALDERFPTDKNKRRPPNDSHQTERDEYRQVFYH